MCRAYLLQNTRNLRINQNRSTGMDAVDIIDESLLVHDPVILLFKSLLLEYIL